MTPALSFIIPVRNDAERLRRCLASIAATVGETPVELIVADNGSTDASPDVARAAGATVLVLPGRRVSQLRNVAAREAHADWLALIDADHELAPGWMAAAQACLTREHVWAAGAEYDTPANGTWVQRMYDRFRAHTPGVTPTDWLPSGNLIVRRDAFLTVGGFDETLESCEDVDFCRRIRQGGGRLIADAGLRSVHLGDPKTLKALFLSELWRGRDNIRVSLRERMTMRSAPSLLIPIINVVALVGLLLGAVFVTRGLGWLTLIGALVVLGFSALRALRLLTRPAVGGRTWLDGPQAFAVAITYELARALALIVRAGHGVRRKG